ncbi:uncharacterized protein [Coffea arabica]|uniref:Retrotransposon gag domain-containing protein n=1 Tax=Coffea arabica TaxID=13443 RepID=A0ABM4VUI6_COFAR
MTNILARLVEQQGQVPVNQPRDPEIGEDRALERFQKFSPSKFLGGTDPKVAERWMETMINIFAVLNYTEERHVNFAVFQFKGPARAWWNVIREKREDDFIKLCQGALSISEYETQFTKLFKFAPELIATEQKRVRRFVQGLNIEIQEALAAAQINTFTEVLEKAQRIEIARVQVKAFHARKKDASSGDQGQEQGDQGMPPPKVGRGVGGVRISGTFKGVTPRGAPSGRGQLRGGSQGDQTSILHLFYGYCGKTNHTEDNCWQKARKCLWCDSAEHQIAICPLFCETQQLDRSNPKQPNIGGNRPRVPSRVYALDHQQVPNPSKVVEGTIHVFHCLAKILIDLGVTHSLVNPNFMCAIDVKVERLPYDLETFM